MRFVLLQAEGVGKELNRINSRRVEEIYGNAIHFLEISDYLARREDACVINNDRHVESFHNSENASHFRYMDST